MCGLVSYSQGTVVLKKSLQTMASAIRKVQERAMKSSRTEHVETEEERSIKALFTDRIVKGRPDLFTPTSHVPSSPTPSDDSGTLQNMLQTNLSGFVLLLCSVHIQFSQFVKQQEDTVPLGKWGERQRDFTKRFSRNDAKYLRDAVSNFCEETRRMYSDLLSPEYIETPLHSPYRYTV